MAGMSRRGRSTAAPAPQQTGSNADITSLKMPAHRFAAAYDFTVSLWGSADESIAEGKHGRNLKNGQHKHVPAKYAEEFGTWRGFVRSRIVVHLATG